VRWWLTVSLLAGCADAEPTPNLCELGQDAYSEAVAVLHSGSKPCTRDDECVEISTDVGCNGFSISLCGAIVHRDSVSLWNPEQVCAELNAYPPARTGCSVEASCVGGDPICQSGRCTSNALVQRPLDSGVKRLDAGRDASSEGG
jgi:hypothetical protein